MENALALRRNRWGVPMTLLDRFFDDDYLSGAYSRSTYDYEEDGTAVIKVETPGVDKKDLNVKLEDDTLRIKAGDSKTLCYTLSSKVNFKGIVAEYKDGLLTVRVPPKEPNVVDVPVK